MWWPKVNFIYDYFYGKPDPATLQKQFDKVLELAQAECQEYLDANCIQNDDEDEDDLTEDKCARSRGTITSLNHDSGILDREIPFSMSKANGLHLSEGQVVSYLWYHLNDAVKVCKIEEIVQENWNQPITDEAIEEVRQQRPEVFSTHLVSRVGYISRKQKDMIIIEGENEQFTVSLDDVETTFMPRTNDQVSFLCKVQRDPKLVDEAGGTVKVVKLEPNITKRIVGKITTVLKDDCGIVADKYMFYWDAIVDEYKRFVTVGDQVSADCIQCEKTDDNMREWRCLKVVLMERAAQIDTDQQLIQPKRKESYNKNGIVITDDIVVELHDINETKPFSIMVKNTASEQQQVVKTVFIGSKSDSQLRLVDPPSRDDSFFLQPNEEREFKFEAKSKRFGEAWEEFFIRFSGPAGQFKIIRRITVIVNDIEQLHPLIGTGLNMYKNLSYTQRVRQSDNSRRMVPGVSLTKTVNFVKVRFQKYEVPKTLDKIVTNPNNSRNFISETLDTALPFLKDTLNEKSYSLVFHNLLYLEEVEMFHNMRRYDKIGFFKREGEYLSFPVQNIAESRPSLVIGDYVKAHNLFDSHKGQGKDDCYQGYIHVIKNDRILLKFSDGFQSRYNCEDYDVKFYFSPVPLRKQHHAIDLVAKNLPLILFPNKIEKKGPQIDVHMNEENGELKSENAIIPWFNQSLNIVQKRAVCNILQGVARPLPYVIFGPPGTGKTVTLIETILQIYKNVTHSRILVATPSNSSANLITERIVDSGVLSQGEFLRLVSENLIQKEAIPDNIIRHCATIDIAREGTTNSGIKLTESGLKMNCNAKFLRMRRVLIGTCITLGTLMQCDFPEGHFTHVIVDESGQCLETEVMIPISFVDKKDGQVILAGDPMQLGPIVLSHFAKNRGLDQSYLVRLLFDRSPYKPDPERFEHRYDPRLVTRLVYNYRSVPSIMSVYNNLFYDKDLKAMVNDVNSAEVELVKQLRPILPNVEKRDPTQAVIFVGVEGKSQQCADSPSWLNKAEANNVLQFLIKLVKMGFNADDIGIITPYIQQAKTIRSIIENVDLVMPKVGTVEEFQGQERKIILVSTVRTLGRGIRDSDKKHKLGFIKHPKRMNVAISRARALLVIFGSPQLLAQDENWKYLMEHCVKNNSSINCDPSILNMKVDSDDSDDDDTPNILLTKKN